MPRGRRVFVCGAWFRFGTDYLQNALYKTLDPTPFLSSSAPSLSALGVRHAVGPYIPYSSAWHPYSALYPTFTGLARTGGGRAADGEGCARAVLDGG